MLRNVSLTCPICNGDVKVTSETGVTCCYKCGYVFNLTRMDDKVFIKFEREDKAKFRRKSFIERDSGRKKSVKRAIEELSSLLETDECIKKDALRVCFKALRNTSSKIDPYVLAASSLIVASRSVGRPMGINHVLRAFREIGKKSRIKEFMKATKIFQRSDVKSASCTLREYVDSVISAVFNEKEILDRVQDKKEILKLRLKVRRRALELLSKIPRKWTYGKRPYSIAAAIVYLAELELSTLEKRNRVISQRILAQCTNQSEYTIKERVIDLYKLGVTFLDRRRKKPSL